MTCNMARNLENEKKKRKSPGRTWNMARNTEKRGKSETNTVGPRLLRQN